MHRDRHVAELLPQAVQTRHVVDVGVGEQYRLDVGAAPADQLDHLLGLQVGVDDNGVVAGLVLDQVGVGRELAVGRRLDVEPGSQRHVAEGLLATIFGGHGAHGGGLARHRVHVSHLLQLLEEP